MDTFHTETESRIPTRLQMVSANRAMQLLAEHNARMKRRDLTDALDGFLRSLRLLRDCRADRNFLWDCAAGVKDQANSIAAEIDAEADQHRADAHEPLDLSELDAFIREVA